ncbi:MAG: hypothetical protein NZ934_04645 [Hadesarchaea archaeon]|nr:hypothetical protein [Hadesarchaea archaeon]
MKISLAVLLSQVSYAPVGSGTAKGIVYLLIAVVLGMVLLTIRPRPKREKPRVFLAREPKKGGRAAKRL